MRSVVVVLPASMWAAMPMFLILSSGTVRAIKVLKQVLGAGCQVLAKPEPGILLYHL
jgi:hypothetical protein